MGHGDGDPHDPPSPTSWWSRAAPPRTFAPRAHLEISLSDPRRTAPARLRTILLREVEP